MRADKNGLLRVLAPRFFFRAVRSFDRRMMAIVGFFWLAACLMLMIAVYSTWLLAETKGRAFEALASEPAVPHLVQSKPAQKDIEQLVNRLEKKYPDVEFVLSRTSELRVSANSSENFVPWLSAMSYVDAVSPNLRWSIVTLCIGSSCKKNRAVMEAVLKPKAVQFVLDSSS